MKLSMEVLRPLFTQLLERSRSNEVNWINAGEQGNDWTEFHVLLPSSKLEIGYKSPSAAEDQVAVWLRNADGTIIFSQIMTDSNPDFGLVKSLYDDAERRLTRADEVLNDLVTQLSKAGTIGNLP